MGKVLIVDDSEFILSMLSEYLIDGGYEVVTATDGIKAVTAVRAEKPDVIIMDIMMPGMDGHTTAKLISSDKAFSKIPIIVFSELDGDRDKGMSEMVGAVAHLKKGAEQDEVLRVVGEAFMKRGELLLDAEEEEKKKEEADD